MDFPNMDSLKMVAGVHGFRELEEGENEAHYREAIADHVESIDRIESMEIRTGKGWDQWNFEEKKEMLNRGIRQGISEILGKKETTK